MIPTFEDIKRYVESAFNAPWWALAAIVAFIICLALRRSKWCPNNWIPMICLILCALFTAAMAPKRPDTFSRPGWFFTNLAIGAILGFLVWGFHNQILKRLAAKFPWLDDILTGGGDDPPVSLTTPAKSDSVATDVKADQPVIKP